MLFLLYFVYMKVLSRDVKITGSEILYTNNTGEEKMSKAGIMEPEKEKKPVRVYLDNCAYNRPYDSQGQMRVD